MYKFVREWGLEIAVGILVAWVGYVMLNLLATDVHDRIYTRTAATTMLTPAMRVGRLVNMVEGWKRQGCETRRAEEVLDWFLSEGVYKNATLIILPLAVDHRVRVVVEYNAQ